MINFFPKNIKECDDTIDKLLRENRKLKQENARLNKIIDELEKEIKITIKKMLLKTSNSSLIIKTSLEIILDRLQELKKEGKE